MTRQVIGCAKRRLTPRFQSEIEAYYNAHKKDFIRDQRVYLREILVSTDGRGCCWKLVAERKANDLYNARDRGGNRFAALGGASMSDSRARRRFGCRLQKGRRR